MSSDPPKDYGDPHDEWATHGSREPPREEEFMEPGQAPTAGPLAIPWPILVATLAVLALLIVGPIILLLLLGYIR